MASAGGWSRTSDLLETLLADPSVAVRAAALATLLELAEPDSLRRFVQVWSEAVPEVCSRLRADPRHKLPFPNVYRIEEVFAIWHRIAAPALWVAADDSDIPRWLAHGGDPDAEIARRMAHVPGARLVTIADAGHMLHHDQPEAVAHELETFLA